MDRFQNTRQPDWDWWSRLWPAPGNTLRELGITAETTLAEVPSGNGYFALPAARITDPNPVYALDLDASLLAELEAIAEQQKLDNVEPIQGDARELATQLPERVDAVLVANTFHGIEAAEAVLEQAFEVLRPGGRLIVVNWRDQPRETTTVTGTPRGPPTDLRIGPAETEEIVVESAPFTRDKLVELPPYHYGLLFER